MNIINDILNWLGSLSNVFAGLLGATLAILSNIFLQKQNIESERKKYLAKLSADFLIADMELIIGYKNLTLYDSRPTLLKRNKKLEKIFLNYNTSATELILISPKHIAMAVNRIAGEMHVIQIISAIPEQEEKYRQALMRHSTYRLELQQSLRKYINSGHMTVDELGHNQPDIENLTSTYQPKGKQ